MSAVEFIGEATLVQVLVVLGVTFAGLRLVDVAADAVWSMIGRRRDDERFVAGEVDRIVAALDEVRDVLDGLAHDVTAEHADHAGDRVRLLDAVQGLDERVVDEVRGLRRALAGDKPAPDPDVARMRALLAGDEPAKGGRR